MRKWCHIFQVRTSRHFGIQAHHRLAFRARTFRPEIYQDSYTRASLPSSGNKEAVSPKYLRVSTAFTRAQYTFKIIFCRSRQCHDTFTCMHL